MKVYPSTTGTAGAVAEPPCETLSLFNTEPVRSTNFTLYVTAPYTAVTVRSEVTLSKLLSQPLKVFPSTEGASGAVAALP